MTRRILFAASLVVTAASLVVTAAYAAVVGVHVFALRRTALRAAAIRSNGATIR